MQPLRCCYQRLTVLLSQGYWLPCYGVTDTLHWHAYVVSHLAVLGCPQPVVAQIDRSRLVLPDGTTVPRAQHSLCCCFVMMPHHGIHVRRGCSVTPAATKHSNMSVLTVLATASCTLIKTHQHNCMHIGCNLPIPAQCAQSFKKNCSIVIKNVTEPIIMCSQAHSIRHLVHPSDSTLAGAAAVLVSPTARFPQLAACAAAPAVDQAGPAHGSMMCAGRGAAAGRHVAAEGAGGVLQPH